MGNIVEQVFDGENLARFLNQTWGGHTINRPLVTAPVVTKTWGGHTINRPLRNTPDAATHLLPRTPNARARDTRTHTRAQADADVPAHARVQARSRRAQKTPAAASSRTRQGGAITGSSSSVTKPVTHTLT